MGKPRGSLTVFAALSFMLIAQLLFTLAEGVRMTEMRKVTAMNTDAVLESVMAEYCIPMWEEYHLLAYDMSDNGSLQTELPESEMYAVTAANFAVETGIFGVSRNNLLRPELQNICIDGYRLLTDQQGTAYIRSVSSYMKQNLSYETAKSVYNNYEATQSLLKKNKNSTDLSTVSDAISVLNQKSGSSGESSAQPTPAAESSSGETAQASESDTSYLQEIQAAQKKGILSLVMTSGASLSASSISTSKVVSHRSLSIGTASEKETVNWYDTVLLQQYLIAYMGSYCDPASDHDLSYELEYLIGGKSSDKANLTSVVEQLLAIREAANMMYLASSGQRQEEVTTLAVTIAGVSANPVVIEAVKVALMAAWAFCESVLDVRALLSGNKIPLMKSDALWTSTVTAIPTLLKNGAGAKSSSSGIGYEDYLGILILMKQSGTVAMRAMDLQELAVRKTDHYSSFQMDHAVCCMSITAEYSWDPVFLSFVSMLSEKLTGFTAENKSSMSYRESE